MSEKTDLRVVKTYKALSEAFIELLSKKRFERITVNELCELAMIRRATFYKHFLDIYDFLSFFITEQSRIFAAACSSEAESPSLNTHIAKMFKLTVRYFHEHQSMIENALKSSVAFSLISIFSDSIQDTILEYIKTHDVQLSVKPETAAAFYAGGIMQTLVYWIQNMKSISEDEIAEQLSILLPDQI